jgi:GNAT superfamily N-acetyltransferase
MQERDRSGCVCVERSFSVMTSSQNGISVRPVAGGGEFRKFIGYPYERNRGDLHWVPPLRIGESERLRPKKNPFFAHAEVQLLLAFRDGRIVGRIAAIDDHLHNQTHRDNIAAFGFFEAEDSHAARMLLESVEQWAKQRGRSAVRGPLNPSLNESAGLLIEGFDTDPMLLMPHNPPEYAAFIERAGYAKVKDLYAWLYDLTRPVGPDIEKMAERVRARHRMVVRPFDLTQFAKETDRLREIYCGAWENNWGFVPPTDDEFKRLASEMKPILDPNCAVCVEVDGRPVACAVAVPDINQALRGTDGRLFPLGLIRLLGRKRIITQVRLLLLGVLPEYRSPGLFPLIISELQKSVTSNPRYVRVEFSWVLEDNHDINKPVERIGAVRYKTYRIYQKALT